jgi:hypothetical protein
MPMQGREASRTAEYMALFRALESARPAELRLFEDRFAKAFLRLGFASLSVYPDSPWWVGSFLHSLIISGTAREPPASPARASLTRWSKRTSGLGPTKSSYSALDSMPAPTGSRLWLKRLFSRWIVSLRQGCVTRILH